MLSLFEWDTDDGVHHSSRKRMLLLSAGDAVQEYCNRILRENLVAALEPIVTIPVGNHILVVSGDTLKMRKGSVVVEGVPVTEEMDRLLEEMLGHLIQAGVLQQKLRRLMGV